MKNVVQNKETYFAIWIFLRKVKSPVETQWQLPNRNQNISPT